MAGSDIWSLLSPFVAAGTAVWLARRQDRERVSCFVGWSYGVGDQGGPYEWAYIGIHNRAQGAVVVRSARFLSGGFPRRVLEGTAVSYEDPFDLNFPYTVDSGKTIRLPLDNDEALNIVRRGGKLLSILNGLLRRPRVMIECVTTGGTRLRGSAEEVLPWDEHQGWARF